jgi:NADP-dependent 3-hydroxy acid dehydrogenase YdfG
VSIFGRVMDVSTRNMRRMFETNFRSVACGLRAAARVQDRLEPGAPIARGSVPGERATPFPSTDAASASAVQASRMGFLAR